MPMDTPARLREIFRRVQHRRQAAALRTDASLAAACLLLACGITALLDQNTLPHAAWAYPTGYSTILLHSGAQSYVVVGVAAFVGGAAFTLLCLFFRQHIKSELFPHSEPPSGIVMPKTRAELALLLWSTAGRPRTATPPVFADIPDPDTAQAAQWVLEAGLMKGRADGTFQPDRPVARWKSVRAWNILHDAVAA